MTGSVIRGIAVAAGIAIWAVAGHAGTPFSLVQTLLVEAEARMDMLPGKVEILGDDAYVLGTTAAGVNRIALYDAGTLTPLAEVTLELMADDMVTDPWRGAIYLIGSTGRSSVLEVYDQKLTRVARRDLGRQLGHPVMSVTPDGFLVIGALPTQYSDGFFGMLDVSSPANPEPRQDFRAPEAWRGAFGAWFDSASRTLFVNAAWDARLMALSSGKERVLSDFSEQSASGETRPPFAVFPLLGHNECRGKAGTSFIVADMERQILSLVDYNARFQTLDTRAFIDFSLARTRATLNTLNGTSLREPSGVLSSSCDQSVVLLGSKTSFEVDQFSRNDDLATLEHVGTIDLPFLPADLDVSADAGFALAIAAREPRIVRLTNAPAGGNGTRALRIIGDPGVRELQRILTEAGLPVGSIDGIIGSNTLRAVSLAEQRFGIELDAQRDLDGSIETLKGALR